MNKIKIVNNINEIIYNDYKTIETDDDILKILNDSRISNLLKLLFKDNRVVREDELQRLTKDEIILVIFKMFLEMNNITINNEESDYDNNDFNEEYFYLDATKQYLREIKKIPLLTMEEEKLLLQRCSSDKEAKDELIKRNLRLVVKIASGYQGRGLEFLELIQEGNIGLMKAIDKYDPKFNTRLSTYATIWINQAIMRALKEKRRLIRLPVYIEEDAKKINKFITDFNLKNGYEPTVEEIAENLHMSVDKINLVLNQISEPVSLNKNIDEDDTTLEDFIKDDRIHIENDVVNEYLTEYLENILKCLTSKEKKVVLMRYYQNMTLEDIGKALQLTRERVRQIEEKSLRKLRHPRNTKKIKDFVD